MSTEPASWDDSTVISVTPSEYLLQTREAGATTRRIGDRSIRHTNRCILRTGWQSFGIILRAHESTGILPGRTAGETIN